MLQLAVAVCWPGRCHSVTCDTQLSPHQICRPTLAYNVCEILTVLVVVEVVVLVLVVVLVVVVFIIVVVIVVVVLVVVVVVAVVVVGGGGVFVVVGCRCRLLLSVVVVVVVMAVAICCPGRCHSASSDARDSVHIRSAGRRRRTASLGLWQQRRLVSRVDCVTSHKRAVCRGVVSYRRRCSQCCGDCTGLSVSKCRQVCIHRRHCLDGNWRRKVITDH